MNLDVAKGYWYRCVDCGQVYKNKILYTTGNPPPHPDCPDRNKNSYGPKSFPIPLTEKRIREIVAEEIAKFKA
jgi:hypothetical protein